MSAAESLESAGRSVLDRLGVAEDPMAAADPVSFLRALVAAGAGVARNPVGAAAANLRLAIGTAAAIRVSAGRAVGGAATGPLSPAAGDKRFADPAYVDNPLYFLIEQQYLLAGQLVAELLDAAGLDIDQDKKARFAATFMLDALAPTNTLAGNPAAIRRAFDTGGKSVVQGMTNMLSDLRHNGGWPSQVDTDGFEVGENMAATPGKVVYRNDLIELIQYEPQTDAGARGAAAVLPAVDQQVLHHGSRAGEEPDRVGGPARPHLLRHQLPQPRRVDARPATSTTTCARARWTRCVSCGRSPGRPRSTPSRSASAARSPPSRSPTTPRSVTARSTRRPSSTPTRTSATPGALGVFTDEPTIAGLEKKMAKKGFLDADTHGAHVRRAACQRPRLPLRRQQLAAGREAAGVRPAGVEQRQHSDARQDAFALPAVAATCDNEFARGEFEVDGQALDPHAVDVDTYVLAAVDDHIVPWVSGYKTAQLLGGKNRFVLSTSGHIAGIVNPPGPKAKHWTNESLPADPQDWKDGADLVDGTWWEDWARWAAKQGGPKVDAIASLGSDAHPPIQPAPGSYVRTRA